MQYLYKDGDSFHFMDTSSYEQLHIDAEVLGDSVNYIIPDALIKVEFYGAEPVGIELPPTVDLKVEDTAPGIKGATASAQVKPARARDRPGRPGAAVRQHRRQDPRQHRDGRVSVASVIAERGPESTAWTSSRIARRRLDRSHHRQHVQRQERRAHPPAAPRADRAAEGPDLQAEDRQPLRRRPHHLAQRDADPVARTSASSRELLDRRRRRTPKSSASTRGSSSTPSCRPSATRSPTRASA